jgi:hypothetical protein
MEDKVNISVNTDNYCKEFYELQDCDERIGNLRREAQEVYLHGTDPLHQLVQIRDQFEQISEERNKHKFQSQQALHEMRCSNIQPSENTYSRPKKPIISEETKSRV